MFENIAGERILITGAGTLTRGLLEHLNLVNNRVAVYSRNEANQFSLREEYPDVYCYLGDVIDTTRLISVFQDFRPTIVIHGAAVKRVDIAQKEPRQTVLTNIVGTHNLLEVCRIFKVKNFVGIDTDKSSDPKTTYGYSKALSCQEILDFNRLGEGRYCTVRYGNVLASRSSVGVIWRDAARAGKNLRLVNGEMTRFFFTITEAVSLIDYALSKEMKLNNYHDGEYGRMYCTEMYAGKLSDLANVIAREYNVKIEEVGGRPGEKMHESLISPLETVDTIRKDDFYIPTYATHMLHRYVMIPHSGGNNTQEFTSDIAPRLTEEQLWTMFQEAIKITYQG